MTSTKPWAAVLPEPAEGDIVTMTAADLDDEPKKSEHGELTPIAEALAFEMLRLITKRGWTVSRTVGFAGSVLLIAVHGVLDFEVTAEADPVPDAAIKLLRKVAHYEGERNLIRA